MDFVTILTDELNECLSLSAFDKGTVKTALNNAALAAIQSGVKGELSDALTKPETGVLLAALQWNSNPLIRQAVKVRGA